MERLTKNARIRRFTYAVLGTALVWSAGASLAAIPRCPEPVGPGGGNIGLGFAIQSNAPSGLPNFQIPVASYGLVVLYPVDRHRIYVQGTYGQEDGLEMILAEAGFRATVPTPFFSLLLSAGMHHLTYENTTAAKSHSYVGPHGGLGLSLDLGSSLEATLGLKLLIQTTPIFSYGATLSIML